MILIYISNNLDAQMHMTQHSRKTQIAFHVFTMCVVNILARFLFMVIEVICGFPQFPQADAKVTPKVGHDLFVSLSVAVHLKSTLYCKLT
jgi:hypothetical protein